MSECVCDPKRLTQELMAAGLPVAGVASSGRIDYSRELTKKEKELALSVAQAHDASAEPFLVRQEAFLKAGVTPEKMLFALWDRVVNGESAAAESLRAALGSFGP